MGTHGTAMGVVRKCTNPVLDFCRTEHNDCQFHGIYNLHQWTDLEIKVEIDLHFSMKSDLTTCCHQNGI